VSLLARTCENGIHAVGYRGEPYEGYWPVESDELAELTEDDDRFDFCPYCGTPLAEIHLQMKGAREAAAAAERAAKLPAGKTTSAFVEAAEFAMKRQVEAAFIYSPAIALFAGKGR